MRYRLWTLVTTIGLLSCFVGRANAQFLRTGISVGLDTPHYAAMPPQQIPIGWGTPYSAGPPAYGWGYGWGNPWQPTWGVQGGYNFQPYYERTVIPTQVKVVYFVHPPYPFVPVHQLPGSYGHSWPQAATRSIQVQPGIR
jgi:hypothetical protein